MTETGPPSPWAARLSLRLDRAKVLAPEAAPWREADVETINEVLCGKSPYSGSTKPEKGARVAFNIASAHIPAFANAGGGYLNRYAVKALKAPLGTSISPPDDARTKIDQVLGSISGVAMQDIHYGALELNGAGVRYYGDFCLVLKAEATGGETLLLDRNSFDLILAPLRALTHTRGAWDPAKAEVKAKEISGTWDTCLHPLAACKVLDSAPNVARRITIGAISEGVLADEDYIEVIRASSFGTAEVAEARTSAGDAAAESHIAERMASGPTPDLAALTWRRQRRQAEIALQHAGIQVRVVTGPGRTKA